MIEGLELFPFIVTYYWVEAQQMIPLSGLMKYLGQGVICSNR